MKDKIIGDLNALFRARAEFYAFFDAQIPKFADTQLFDFKALRANGSTFADSENAANDKNAAFVADKNFAPNSAYTAASGDKCGENSANSAANSAQSVDNVDLEQIYKLFHHYDYAIRKLLPSIYKAYEIDSERDLSKDF